MYNKKALRVDLGKYKKSNPYKGDIEVSNTGQWGGKGIYRIPSNDITMQGVPFPVMAYPSVGEPVLMQPGQDYQFPDNVDYVDEYPVMQKGGFHDDINKRRQVLRDWVYGADIGMLQEQDGGIPYNTSGPVSEQAEIEEYTDESRPKVYGHEPEDYSDFLAYSATAPENRRAYSDYVYGNPDDYDQYGFWDSLGKPKDWETALQLTDEETGEPLLQPDPYDNMYHGFSINPNTGVFLKSGKPGLKPEDTTWMEIAGHYQGRDAQNYTPVFDPELGRFKYIPNEYIEADLTDEEIEEYRKGGYIVEDISVPTLTKAQKGGPQSGPKPGGLIPAKTAAQVQKEELAKGKGPTRQSAQKINQAAAEREKYEKQEAARKRAEEAKRLKQEAARVSPASSTAVVTDTKDIDRLPTILDNIKADNAYKQQMIDRGYVAEAYKDSLYNQTPTTKEYFQGYRSLPDGELTQEDIVNIVDRDKLEEKIENAKYDIWRRNEEREYQNTPWYGKALNEAQAFMADPYLHTERALQGKRSLLGQGQVIVAPQDYENARFYDRAHGNRGVSNTIGSEVIKIFNPMYYGAAAGVDARKGAYGSAAANVAQGLLSGSGLSKSDKLKKMFDTQMFLQTLQEAPETISAWSDPESNPYLNTLNTMFALGYGRSGLKNLKPGAKQIASELRGAAAYQQGGYIELELTPEEITQYKNGGYYVEELPYGQEGFVIEGKSNVIPTKSTTPIPVKKVVQQEKVLPNKESDNFTIEGKTNIIPSTVAPKKIIKPVDRSGIKLEDTPFAYKPLSKFISENPIQPAEEVKMKLPDFMQRAIDNPSTQAEKGIIETISDKFSETVEQGKRFLEKQGIIDTEDKKLDITKIKAKKAPVTKATPKPAKFYQELGSVQDSYAPDNYLLSYRNQWDNNDGFEYIATPVKKDRTGNEEYKNVKGVGHFLLDASVADNKVYKWADNESFLRKAKENNEWIPAFQRVKGDRVKLKYKKPDELTKSDIVVTPLRQMNFDEISFDKTKRPEGFQSGIKEVTKKDGNGTYLIFKDRNGYSRFSGGSVVFIFKDKYGNTIVRDYAGTLNGIENEGIQIKKQYGLKPNELTIGYHDVGSFSAKPKANKDGVLRSSQWEGYNTADPTGGALLIPND